MGVPIPSTVFILASGAFVQQGVLDLPSTAVVALVCAVAGDTSSYGMGRLLRRPILARFGQTRTWQRAEVYFRRRGASGIYLTRWAFTPLSIPVNLVAGSSDYPLRRFVACALAGECTWVGLYGTLGYLFGSQWELVNDFLSNFTGLAVGLGILGAGLVWWLRRPRG